MSIKLSPSINSSPKKDTTVCKNQSVSLYAGIPVLKSTTSYTVASIGYIDTLPCESVGSLVAGSGINIDDAYSAVQNIGFNFCFFGNTFSQLQICDNGFLTFSTNKPVLSPLTAPYIAQTLPLATHPNPSSAATTIPPNSILGAWMDAYLVASGSPPGGGNITVQLVGVAPFRAYIVKWNDCRYYHNTCRGSAAIVLTMKVVLYETTNLIDIYIKKKPICTTGTTFRYNTTQGLQGDSTFKYIVTPGRNASLFVGDTTAVRYTPNGTTTTSSIQWTKNGTVVSNTPTATISATDDTGVYVATATFNQPCPSTIIARDTLRVYGLTNNVTNYDIYDTIACIGSKTLNATNAGVLGYLWDNGSTAATRTVSATGTYYVVRRYNTLGCTRDTVFYRIKKYSSIKIDSIQRMGCFNSLNNGQIRLFISGDTSGLKIGTTSNPTSTTNPITNIGYGTKSFWISNGGNCRDSLTVMNDSLRATYSKRVNYCNQDSSGMMKLTMNSGYSPYTFGLTGRANQSIDSFTKITTGTYTISVTDKNGCSYSKIDTIIPFTNLSLSIVADSAKCFGSNTGKITATLSGGVPAYQYSINNGAFVSSGVFNSLVSATYLIKTKDSKNCPIDTTITIYQYSAITASTTKTSTCLGQSTGSVSIVGSGGNPPYQYRVNGGAFQTSGTFTGLSSGVFAYSVKDANNCIVNFNDTIVPFAQPNISLLSKKDVSCYMLSDGKIRVTTTGGTPPYNYNWGTGNTTDSAINLFVANYITIVTDNKGCKDTLVTPITQPDSVYATFNQNNPLCYNQSNGWIKINGTGGMPPYQYAIDGGSFSTMDSFTNLSSGTHTIAIRDANLCAKSFTRTLTNPTPVKTFILVDSVMCYGGNSGKITMSGTGGKSPYQYALNGGTFQTTNVFNALAIGTYNLSVRDSNNCQFDTTATIYQYTRIMPTITLVDTIRCKNGSDGKISITSTGGLAPYQYALNGGTYQTSNIFSNLNKGTKYISVKDAKNCIVIDSIVLQDPPGMTPTFTIQNNVICYGQSNGKAKVSVIGGVPPYSYLWSNGLTIDSNTTLNAANHYVRLTDSKNCKDSIPFVITQPDSLRASISLYHPLCSYTLGSIKVNSLGGTSPYTISFDGGAFSTTDSFSNLIGKPYSIIVKDNNQCQRAYTSTLITPQPITANYLVDSVQCFGASTGKISITASGGTGAFTYKKNTITQPSNVYTSLLSATYLVGIFDANNCKLDSNITVYQYPDIILTNSKDTIKCYGTSTGTITANGSGGAGGFQYRLNTGTYGTTSTFTGLAAGTHTVYIQDKYSCTKNQSVSLTQIDSMIITTQLTHNPCYGDSLGKVKLILSGGTSPYQYAFNGGTYASSDTLIGLKANTYNYSVRDANNCVKSKAFTITQPNQLFLNPKIDSVKCYGQTTGSIEIFGNGGTTPYQYKLNVQPFGSNKLFTNLAAGFYTISIRDNNLCRKDSVVQVKTSDSFYLSYVVDSLKCNNDANGRIIITPSGGKFPYSYSVNGGAYGSNNIIQNLSAGSYAVSVKDGYNCLLNFNATLLNPAVIAILIDSFKHNPCFGDAKGEIYISSNGGRLPHTYSWSNGATAPSIIKLIAANYTVSVQDANGCMKNLTTTITQPTSFAIDTTNQNIRCYGETNGAIQLAISGASPPYQILWNTGSTALSLSNLSKGNYTVTITDTNACATTRTINIAEPDSLYFTLNKTNSSCLASNNGSIEVRNLRGGVGGYSYSWSNGSNASRIDKLIPFNSFTVTVSDANNCSRSDIAYIDTQYILRVEYDTVAFPRCPSSPFNFNLMAVNGTPTLTYAIGSYTNTNGIFTNIPNGVYPINVVDAVGCNYTDTIDIRPSDTMVLDLVLYPPPCDAANIFPVKANVTGSKKPYIFSWQGASQIIYDSARYAFSGTFRVDITDAYNCKISEKFKLQLPEGALQAKIDKTNLKCFGIENGEMKVLATGGIPPYTYQWSTGATTDTIQGLKATKLYSVIVTDSDTCKYTLVDSLTQPQELKMKFKITDKICPEDNKGSITVLASGGTTTNNQYLYSIDSVNFSSDLYFAPLRDSTYQFYVKDMNGCMISDSATVAIRYKINLTIDSVYYVDLGKTVSLLPNVNVLPLSAPVEYLWSPSERLSCSDCLFPIFSGYITTPYTFQVNYGEGCTASVPTKVIVPSSANEELYIPNAFSPNAQNVENRRFRAYANHVLRYNMQVFNRWGEKVFETDDIRIGWDGMYKGEPAPLGVYVYNVEVTKLDGIRLKRNGTFELLY